MNKKLKGILLASAVVLGMNGCVESVKPITLSNGQKAEQYSLSWGADPRHSHFFYRYAHLMYDKGFRMKVSMINIHGSTTVTLKVKEWQNKGLDFSLHPMILNGVKPLSCSSSKKPGYAIRYLECQYNKRALINSMGKPFGPKEKNWKLHGIFVDESANGTLSEAWKCSKKYLPSYYAASNMAERISIKYKASDCVKQVYKIYRPTPGPIEDYFTYEMAAFGNKHYRFNTKSDKEFIQFLSK
ncbi:MAG TPA: hypothetical protein EYH42_04455 [Sulfurovum sp.]|nr:hypothetical protein [Sulfurovum sp.]